MPLSDDEAGYVQAARAANTLRGYQSEWREFTHWFVDLMLQPLVAQEFHRYVFCLGHLADQVIEHPHTRWQALELSFHVDEEPRGTGGALVAATPLLDERFLLVLGDTYLDIRDADLSLVMPADGHGAMAVPDAVTGVPGNVLLDDGLDVAYDKGPGPAQAGSTRAWPCWSGARSTWSRKQRRRPTSASCSTP